jgi:hypothetical protein
VSWRDHDTEGVRKLESSLDELAESLEGDWTTGDRFDMERYRELRQQGVGEPPFGKQVRSGHWKDSGAAKQTVEEGKRFCDSTGRKGITQVLLIALTAREVENLERVAEGHRLKNMGAIVRDLISKAAKAT